MEDDASGKLTSLLDSLPQSANKLATIEEISVVLCAVTPASLRAIVPNLSFNTVFECLAFCTRYVMHFVESSLLERQLGQVEVMGYAAPRSVILCC